MDKYVPLMAPNFDPEEIIDSEVIEHTASSNDRSLARQMALQVLYEVDSAGHPVGEVLNAHLDRNPLERKISAYLDKLIENVLENLEILDKTIQHYAPEWPLSQIAVVDRNILRLAVCEVAIVGNISEKIVIDEAVELGKLFGAEGTPRFINGVLGAMITEFDTMKQMLGLEA